MTKDWAFLNDIPKTLPLLALHPPGIVLFPGIMTDIYLELKDEADRLYLEALQKHPYLLMKPQLPLSLDKKNVIGVLAKVVRNEKAKDNLQQVDVEVVVRTLLTNTKGATRGYPTAKWVAVPDLVIPPDLKQHPKLQDRIKRLEELFTKFLENREESPPEEASIIKEVSSLMKERDIQGLSPMVDGVMNLVNLTSFRGEGWGELEVPLHSYMILVERNPLARMEYVINLLELILKMNDEPETENGDATPKDDHYEKIKDRIPEEARKEIEKELVRLKRNPHSSEASMVQEHLDLLLNMPWGVYTEDTKDINAVRRILDEDHAGLDKIKERIIEFIAVRQLNPSVRSPILCFVGPPGVGKTSLGQSIARALGRKFTSLALGGMTDENEIRGHRGTYINAKPGQIIEALRRCGSANPVFMLDEIDKVGRDWRGDPSSALLEVLDPEQNNKFLDRYLNVKFDLSRVLFITTANITETILPALKDRMEIIELPGYSPTEKVRIAHNHLVKRRRAENGFPIKLENQTEPVDITFSDGAILKLIHQYTSEAGVRSLERELDRPFRKVATEVLSQSGVTGGTIKVTEQNVHKYCGKPSLTEHKIKDVLPSGVVPVLATTDSGGYIFEAEVTINHNPGGRKVVITGVRGSSSSKDAVNIIEDSLKNAFDFLTSRGRILFERIQNIERQDGPLFVKGSVTNGAVPKDGPSAGVSILIAVYGALTGQSIKSAKDAPLLAATGEITVNLDEIRAVGGIRDKILAAHRNGIRKLIIPKDNESDLEDVPSEILADIEIKPLQSMLEALAYAYPEDERIKEYIERTQRSSS